MSQVQSIDPQCGADGCEQDRLAHRVAPRFIVLCRYTLHPAGMGDFLKLAGETAQLRAKLLPFLG